jgi:hypothetical protein
MDVSFHRLAAREYREARAWYERRQAGLGDAFRVEINRAVGRIESHPERWPVFRERFRKVRLRRFSYTLFYRITGPESAVVLAVAHNRRRPGYWVRRETHH